ncbi:hypothetical protein [Rhodalgimonas zhirmunskyi]|uniref:Uncharacterized protein n=1 Tax=Rhodalgimonas zhirmunskyi TaxID=2964767 RepID=A0AAJ1X494_9RHOB|nr:hypothetical protein [Rhodoalgimonas zhirmunskyi]MDQ2093261.1 hypothetical protein [Rhodoalgimonas zhirmunskyi]
MWGPVIRKRDALVALGFALAMQPIAGHAASDADLAREAARAVKVLKPQEGKRTSAGQLRRVWSKGKILGYDFTALAPEMQKPGAAREGLKKAYPKIMTDLYCRKGSSSRAFIQRGGEVQLSTYDRKNRLIHAARLTKCR